MFVLRFKHPQTHALCNKTLGWIDPSETSLHTQQQRQVTVANAVDVFKTTWETLVAEDQFKKVLPNKRIPLVYCQENPICV